MPFHRLSCLLATCWIGCAMGIAQASPEQPAVLFLEQDDSGRPGYLAMMRGFRQAMDENLPGMVDVYSENLDLARFSNPEYLEHLSEWFRLKYKDKKIDVVISFGATSTKLARQIREEFWPDARILEIGGNVQEGAPQDPHVASLGVSLDVAGTLQAARTLMPDASRLVVVVGAKSAYAGMNESILREVSAAAERYGLTMETLEGLSFDETRHRLSLLPRDAMVLYGSITTDGDGRSFIPRDALVDLSRASGAPIFGLSETFMGFGMTGGAVLRMEELGREFGGMTAEALMDPNGHAPASRQSRAYAIMFDWQELQKFGLAGRPLPDGAEIHFEPPSLWESHRTAVLGTGAFLAGQSAWIAALIIQLRLRRRAEQQVNTQRDQLAHAGRLSSLGQLAASIAHELNQPLGAILRNAGAAERLLQHPNPDIAELRAIIADIQADDTRASHSIERMRAMLNRRPMAFATVDMKQLLNQTAALLKFEANRRGVDLKVVTATPLPLVHGDPTCLQQILINLVINSMDALDGKPDGTITMRAETHPSGDTIILRIQDNGQGIPAAIRASIFEPFHTTKPAGMGMGLAICQTIAEAHGGSLKVEKSGPDGTCFSCALLPATSPAPA